MIADLDLDLLADVRARACPRCANRRPEVLADGHRATAAPTSAALILDAAVRVFARQGFNGCRVSDIADEAGVAYGLVYHYFRSKDEVLDTLFLERWNVLLEAIREIDAPGHPAAREALRDRLVHRRLLPPRPRPDEGHHRRGHARGELVRPDAPRRRSARPMS